MIESGDDQFQSKKNVIECFMKKFNHYEKKNFSRYAIHHRLPPQEALQNDHNCEILTDRKRNRKSRK